MKTVTKYTWVTDPKTGIRTYRIKKFKPSDPDYELEKQREQEFLHPTIRKSEFQTISGKV